MNRGWLLIAALSVAQASPHLAWFEAGAGNAWSARSRFHRTQVSARGMRFATGLDLRFLGAADCAPIAGETFSLTRLGWQRSDRRTYKARQDLRFAGIYPGIDVRYHLSEGQLEYDLLLAPEASLDRVRIRSNQPPAFLPDGSVRFGRGGQSVWKRPAVAWYASGVQETIAVRYVPCGADICFAAKYDHSRSVVIDPVVAYASYFGGAGSDVLDASTTDAHGNLYVSGTTASADFPFMKPGLAENLPDNGYPGDGYLAKFSPAGQLIYATLYTFGGTPLRMAVDSRGSVYIVTNSFGALGQIPDPAWIQKPTQVLLLKFNAAGNDLTYRTYLPAQPSAILPDAQGNLYLTGSFGGIIANGTPGAFRTTGPTFSRTLVKLSSGGSTLLAATYLEAPGDSIANMAWDSRGNLVVAGTSNDTSPRGNGALQALNAGVASYRSADGGASWNPDAGSFQPSTIVPDQAVAGRLWGLGSSAFWASVDFGRTWEERSDLSGYFGLTGGVVSVPGNPDLLYLLGFNPLKSIDGGVTWASLKTNASFGFAIDPNNTDTVVSFSIGGVLVSRDGGETWASPSSNLSRFFNFRNPQGFFADPSNPGRTLFYDSSFGLLALDFTTLLVTTINTPALRWIGPDPAVPGRVLMIGAPNSGPAPILASMDGGVTTTPIGALPVVGQSLVVDPAQPNTFYLSSFPIQKTSDGGQTWTVLSSLPAPSFGVPLLVVNPLQHTELLMVKGIGTDALVSSFSADLSTLRFSTYFGGNADEQVSGLALGPDDSITIVGVTTSTDLAQNYGSSSDIRAGTNDIFIARLSPDGRFKLAFRLLGGDSAEYPSAAALDSVGNLIFDVYTYSANYPVTSSGAFPKTLTPSISAPRFFLTVLAPDFSVRYSAFMGGNAADIFQPPVLLPDGTIWLTATTTSTDLPASSSALHPLPMGFEDIYLMRMDWRQ